MAPTKAEIHTASDSAKNPAPPVKQGGSVVPEWLSEEYFVELLAENVEGFKRIQHFEVTSTGGGGENYCSLMFRVKVKVELEDGATKDVAYMIKTVPQGEQGAMMVNLMGQFPKETTMYGKILPEFEQMYRDVGKTVSFGPKFFEFKKNPGDQYVLLEDLCASGFKNANRLEGLDEEHTLSVLKIIAEMHAVSAVRYETVAKYNDQLMGSLFSEKFRKLFETMDKTIKATFLDCLSSDPKLAKYLEKVKSLQTKSVDLLIATGNIDPNDFNVIIHGDLWSNNVMFRYNDSGELDETKLIDFQVCRYASPVVDLFYFLLSSTKLELKVANFDKFVRYYHEQLVDNLTLLKYPKKIPTLRDLHMQLLKHGIWGYTSVTGIMGAVLMNPNENADIEKFLGEGEESNDFQKQMLSNPRYLKHLDVVLDWLDLRGLLDF